MNSLLRENPADQPRDENRSRRSMTGFLTQRTRTRPGALRLWSSALSAISLLLGTAAAVAQSPGPRSLHHEYLPPGVIGQQQLLRHPGMPGYIQAVEILVPPGGHVSFLQGGAMSESLPGPVLAGMQVGSVYSLKLSRLPNREGVELFPTIEVINRLHPPEGVKTRFPVPIEISEEDISQALAGLFVTRIVYLEDPETALPRPDQPGEQRSINVAAHEDPLHVADRMGRPMAIVRIGSRIPSDDELAAPGYPSPPVHIFPAPRTNATPAKVTDAIERNGADIPRVPEPPLAPLQGAWLYPERRVLR